MVDLIEADIESTAADHWGDYTKEHGDPYPATQAAQAKVTEDVRGDRYEDPEEVRTDLDAFATQPMKYARPVRVAPADQWGAMSYGLADGGQGFQAVGIDPTRRSVTIYNHSTGGIFIAPSSTRIAGAGAHYIPGVSGGIVNSRRLETSGEVYVFTLATFVAGAEPVQVSIYFERYA